MTENNNSGACRMKQNVNTTEETTRYNQEIVGKKFDAGEGMVGTYIIDNHNNWYGRVAHGFYNICHCIPHHGFDHGVYAKRDDGHYIGVGQPYPLSSDQIDDIKEYCKTVGITMTIVGKSTWAPRCMRILFQRDGENTKRYDIAFNSSKWREGHDPQYTQAMVEEVERRLTNGKR